MESEKVLKTALEFEKKICDVYRSAESTVDDARGKSIFRELASDEQSHIDFLENSLELLQKGGKIDPDQLQTTIPDAEALRQKAEKMKTKVPEKMLGDVKTIFNSALKMEIETSDFYREAAAQTEGDIRRVMEKFLEIEERHTAVVRFELDYAARNGHWFDFMEQNMEVGWHE
ncbi:MAG TPA: ferritin family protein [Desulfopila sp.]|nr:ferritin family protein [Desulfopila sp.]